LNGLVVEHPRIEDGPAIWRVARDSAALDLNSPYAYLLWCRDFAATSLVVRQDTTVAGFVTGYLRPDAPEVLVVWQITVATPHRGQGLAARLLDELITRCRPRYVETTITPDNPGSIRLFTVLSARHNTRLDISELFPATVFPVSHEPEHLYRIGPFGEP
jgi:diaminobutyrate acetyltransferase